MIAVLEEGGIDRSAVMAKVADAAQLDRAAKSGEASALEIRDAIEAKDALNQLRS